MSILSITFHTTERKIADWDIYLESELHQMVENLLDVASHLTDEHFKAWIRIVYFINSFNNTTKFKL